VVALEPDTGQPKFIISIPMSVKGAINWEKRNVKGRAIPVCSLEDSSSQSEKSISTASEHGKLVSTSAGFIYLPFLVQSEIFDGLPCEPSSDPMHPNAIDIRTSTFKYSATLQVMQIGVDGTYSLITLDSASYVGANWNAPVPHFGPTERAIPDGNDDDELLLPSIVAVGSRYLDGRGGLTQSEGRVYCFTKSASSHFSVPLLPSSPSDALLTGEHSNAVIMGSIGKQPVIAAINLNKGVVKWLTPTPFPQGAVQLDGIMSDDSVIFEHLHDGQSRLMMADPTGNVKLLLPYSLSPLTGFNGPSYWGLSTWFIFLNDQSIARVSRTAR
jgi:hypothetical protein